MTYNKKKGTMSVDVVIRVEVPEKEWMSRYGEHITANQLVPEVTLERALRKAAKTGMESLGIPGLEVDGRRK